MKAASEATLANKADLGIIFDTDVDRAAVVDSDGTEINRDRLIALLAGMRACATDRSSRAAVRGLTGPL